MRHWQLSFLLILIVWVSLLGDIAGAKDVPLNPPVTHNANGSLEENKKSKEQEKHNTNTPAQPSAGYISRLKEQKISTEPASERSTIHQQPKDDRMWPPTAEWAAAYVGIASVIMAIIYAVISFCQWRTIRETLNVTRDQNRPWIIVTPDNPQGWPLDGIPSSSIWFFWSAENVGKSPALLTQLWFTVVVAPYPVPDTRPGYGETSSFAKFIIPPGRPHTSSAGETLTESDIADITAGRKCLMFYGIIRYNDTLNLPYTTHFCSYWFMINGGRGFSPIGPSSYTEYT